VRAQAGITSRVQVNELYMSMKFCGRVGQSPDQQPYGQSNSHPGYKETSVQMRVLGEIGDDSRSMPPNRTSRCAIRNAIILGKILRSISPDVLQGIAVAISETLGYYVKQSLSRQASGIKSSCVEAATKHGHTARSSPRRRYM
jgi:hypothetical protein